MVFLVCWFSTEGRGLAQAPLSPKVSTYEETTSPHLESPLPQVFDDISPRGRRWWSAWIAINAALVVSNTTLAALEEEQGERMGFVFSAVGSGITTLQMAIFPEVTLYASRRLQRLHSAEARTRVGCALLEKAASRQASYRAPLAFIMPGLWAAGVSTYLQLRYENWAVTGRVLGGVLLTTLLRIFTSPRNAIRAHQEAMAENLCKGSDESQALLDGETGKSVEQRSSRRFSKGFKFDVTAHFGGLHLRGTW